MGRMLLGSLVSGVVLFLWGFVFWGLVPPPEFCMRSADQPDELAVALNRHLPVSGTYFLPRPATNSTAGDAAAAFDAFVQKHRAGPVAQIHVLREGTDPMSGLVYALGFAYFVFSSLLAAGLLRLAAPALAGYWARVGFVALLGLFATAFCDLAGPVWFHHHPGFAAWNALYHAVCWILGGVVLGAFVRPTPASK